jgi:hypothetical protein
LRKAQFIYLAIHIARFFLLELHDVIRSAKSWSGTVRLTCQLKRDLELWTNVPTQHNNAPIWKPIKNDYLHCESTCYGWGAVLNDCIEARGFWTAPDLEEHITSKELKAIQCAIHAFQPELKRRRLLIYDGDESIVRMFTHLTSKTPTMMCEQH